MKGKWHHQLMKHEEPDGTVWYGIHEYYDLPDGPVWTERAFVEGDTPEDIKWALEAMIKDIDKHGAKDYE